MIGNSVVAIAEKMVSLEWGWDKASIEKLLLSLGWERREGVLHRDAYVLSGGLDASVYNEGDMVKLVEVEIDVFSEVDSLDDLEYEDTVDEFYKKFLVTTKQLTEPLGQPAFSDGAAANGFPDDQDAVWLSLWNLPTARFMVQQKHEDRDIPFRLCFVVAPRAS